MTSPHLIRPFSARQLSLLDDDVVTFAVLGGRFAGPSVQAHAPSLIRRVSALPPSIHTVVFIDVPVPDAAILATIDDMIAHFDRSSADVLASHLPATEAVKRVEGDLIVEGIPRNTLVSIRCPEVIDREALSSAMQALGDRQWVNPTAAVAADGGTVRLYDRPLVPRTRRGSSDG